MIGIEFKIPNEWNNYLYKILAGIDSRDFYWEIVEDEVLASGGGRLFLKEKYGNIEFKKLLSSKHYSIFANIQMCLHQNNESTEITNYSEFMASEYYLVIFITDNIFVDVYSKSEEILKIIENNAKQNNFTDIKFIESVENVRKNFSAYDD